MEARASMSVHQGVIRGACMHGGWERRVTCFLPAAEESQSLPLCAGVVVLGQQAIQRIVERCLVHLVPWASRRYR